MRTMVKVKFYSEAFARLVAGFAGADVRTVRRFLEGKTVKGAGLRERLEAAKAQAEQIEATHKKMLAKARPPAKARRSK